MAQCWVTDTIPQKEPGSSKVIPPTDHTWLGHQKTPPNTCYTRTRQSSGSWRRHTKQHVSFINFELLEFYWTYLLALQITNPKVFPKRLMSLGHKSKMRWHTLGFVAILCKYGLLLKKSLVMSVREVIGLWALIHCLNPIHMLMLMMSWVMIHIDEEEMWTMNPPLEVRILRTMWAQSMRYKLILGIK